MLKAKRFLKLCGCGCGKPLEPRVDGERSTVAGREVNPGCWDQAAKKLERYPIPRRGIRRRA